MKMVSINSRKMVIVLYLFVFVLSAASCKVPEDKVIVSLGEYENRVFFTSGGFQDYTDYAKYYYTSVEVADNQYLAKIQENDLTAINTHLDDFEEWIEVLKDGDASREIVVNYDFDRGIIDTEDYIYIDSEEYIWSDGHRSFVKYNLYFFDTQTQVLYYFHNNI